MKPFPYKIQDVSEDIHQTLEKDFPGKFVTVGPSRFFLSKNYENFAEKYYNFRTRKEDVFIAGFPRSGTTLLQELVWLLCNGLDLEKGRNLERNKRVFNFEVDIVTDRLGPEVPAIPKENRKYFLFEDFDEIPGPRVFKTHLPLSLLPHDLLTSGSKVIYIARNPKDVMVSLYHFLQRITYRKTISSDFDTFVGYFLRDQLRFTPYWATVDEYWQQKSSDNLLFLFYEDFIKDLRGTIVRVANYLDKPLTATQLDLLTEVLAFDNFKGYFQEGEGVMLKRNDGHDDHVRRGKFGESRAYFGGSIRDEVDRWTAEHVTALGIKHSYLD